MAVDEPAHPIEKRDLLHAEHPNKARIQGIGRKLSSQGRNPEAIDYVEISPDPALLEEVRKDAVARGSAWLLAQVERVSGRKSDPATWERLSEAAARSERWLDAVRALQTAGKPEEAEALRLEKCPDYEPFKPLGK
jgi:hypothetical protein